jgi:Flp pilus assembly pilin Flp
MSLPLLPSHLRGKSMKNHLMRLWKEEEGQDVVEYALLLVLISLIAILSMKAVGVAVSNVFSNAAANLTT